MKNITILCLIVLTVLGGSLFSCKEFSNKSKAAAPGETGLAPAGYDFALGEKITLKKKLNEISGIHYLKENLLAAIQDEKGIIFTVDFSSDEIRDEYPFAGPGDYEDLTMDDQFFYVLESSGKIFRISRKEDAGEPEVFEFPSNKKMEFETLYLDPSGSSLILVCKRCGSEGRNKTINAYSFSLKDEQFSDEPVFTMEGGPAKDVLEKTGARPSAAAIHPVQNKLYVLCSVGKLLVIADLEGRVENAYPLDPAMFKQPEGIAFGTNGDMFISNEAMEGAANILKFSYKP